MPSAFTGNIMEGQIAIPTSTLGFLVNQLSMVIPIRVRGIPANWISRYTVYLTQEYKQRGDKWYGWGEQARGSGQRGTQNRSDYAQTISGRDPKLYTGEFFLVHHQNWKGHSNHILMQDTGNYTWQKFWKTFMGRLIHFQNAKNIHTLEVQHYA